MVSRREKATSYLQAQYDQHAGRKVRGGVNTGKRAYGGAKNHYESRRVRGKQQLKNIVRRRLSR